MFFYVRSMAAAAAPHCVALHFRLYAHSTFSIRDTTLQMAPQFLLDRFHANPVTT